MLDVGTFGDNLFTFWVSALTFFKSWFLRDGNVIFFLFFGQRKMNFSPNSRPYTVLKLPRDPYGLTTSSSQCLFSDGPGLHPRIACSLLIPALHPRIFCTSCSRPHISVFTVVTLLILSRDGCICQLHPPVSLPVKAIYFMSPSLNYVWICHFSWVVYCGYTRLRGWL